METATKSMTTAKNPMLSPVLMAKVTGIVLLLVALLGLFMENLISDTFLTFDMAHTALHFVLAAIALVVGFAPFGQAYAVMYAKVFGVVYLLLGLIGFFVDIIGPIGLELGENLVHILIGAWALLAGFMGAGAPA